MFRRIQYCIIIAALLGMSACERDRSPFSAMPDLDDGLAFSGRGGFGSFAWDTPVALDGSTFRKVQDIKAGDAVYACDTTLQWHQEILEWAFGLGPSEISPHTMCWVVYDLRGTTASVMITTDMLFVLSNGKYKTADHLLPGDKLMGADGNSAAVQFVELGLSNGGLQTISTDELMKPGGGHLLNVNGVLCGDAAFNMWHDGYENPLGVLNLGGGF